MTSQIGDAVEGKEHSDVDVGEPEDLTVAEVDQGDAAPAISDSDAAEAGTAVPIQVDGPDAADDRKDVPEANSSDAADPDGNLMQDAGQLNGSADQDHTAEADPEEKPATAVVSSDGHTPAASGAEGISAAKADSAARDDANAEDDPMKLPPYGTEIFLGNIPHAASREEIESFCHKVAPLHSLHIPAPKTEGSANPGYAFAMFKTKVAAAEAIEQLGGATMPSGPSRHLTVKYASKQRNKLYICNIPKSKTRQQLLATFRELTPGVVDLDVTMQKDQGKPSENRGFCFLDMYNQAAAEQAMATLASPTLQFGGESLSPSLRVEWADTKAHEADQADVKSLHISNLPEDCTEEQIRAALEGLAPIERVALLDQKQSRPGDPVKKREYAFVHYNKRSTALKVLEACQESAVTIGDTEIYVSMAKPVGSTREGDRGRDMGMRAGDRGRMPPRYGGRGPGMQDDWDGSRGMMGMGRRSRDRSDVMYDSGYDRRPPMRERDRGLGSRGPMDRRVPGNRMGDGWGGDGYSYDMPPMMGRVDPWQAPPKMDAQPMMPMPYVMPGMMQGMMQTDSMGVGRGPSRGDYEPMSRPKPSTGGYGAARGSGRGGGFGTAATRGYGSGNGSGGRAPQASRGYQHQRYGPY